MTIGRKIGLNFALAMAAVVAIGALTYWCTVKLITTSHWVTHTYQALEGVEGLLSSLKDAETGQRGYLLTGKALYLEPYEKGLKEIEKGQARLKSLTQDNPTQQERLEKLSVPIADKLRELAETIEVRRKDGFEAALAIVVTDRGKRSMDEARALMDAIKAEELAFLERRSTDANRTATLANLGISVGVPMTLILLSIAGFVISRSITSPIRSAVAQLASSSSEILATTTEQAAGAQEQAVAVSQTVTTVDEVAQTASQGAQRAKSVGEAVQRNFEVGQAGRKSVEDSLTSLDRLRDQVESTAGNILMLADQAQAIGEIIATVNDIAEQTNMLALNAAIEASRAGEHGRGFAVVASEVKALADQSKKATAQVRQILGEIQRATNTAVLSTEEVTKGVAAAIRSGRQSGETINALADTLADASSAAAQIVASAGQQAVGMQQINQAMKNLDQVAKQNLAAMQQAEQAARNLNELGGQLAGLLGR